MLSQRYDYPLVSVYDLTLDPGESYKFPAMASVNCVGTIYVYGVIIPQGGGSGPAIVEHLNWRPRAAWGVWHNESQIEGDATFKAGPDGARWLCLVRAPMRDAEGNIIGYKPAPSVQELAVEDSATVPAGWAWIVVRGSVVADGQAGEVANYFGERETDTEVTGAADLLLVQ